MTDATADLGDVLAGLRTDPLDDTVHATSATALIKAVDAAGQPVWALRTGGDPISSEELLGALDAYAESLRHELADTWGQ